MSRETPVRAPNQIQPHAFFLTPANRHVLNSNLLQGTFNVPHSAMNSERTLATIMVAIVVTVILFTFESLLWPLAALLGVAVVIRSIMVDERKLSDGMMKRVREEGYILPGEILKCSARIGSANMIQKSGVFLVQVEYQFATPTERIIQSHKSKARNDLAGEQLPIPGTTVYVLYFSDDE